MDYPQKPKQTRGTPMYIYRNYFAAAVLVVATGLGFGIHFLVSRSSRMQEFLKNFEGESEYFARRRGALSEKLYTLGTVEELKSISKKSIEEMNLREESK